MMRDDRRRAVAVPGVRAALLAVTALCVFLPLAACADPVQPPPLAWADDPVQPAGRRVATLATAFESVCALSDAGLVWCVGENRMGEFGDGTTRGSEGPVAGAGGLVWRELFGSSGNPRICGLDLHGRAHCWGYNVNGAVGDGSTIDRRLPAPVQTDLRFASLATSHHTCALTEAGEAHCWGPVTAALGAMDRDSGWQTAPRRVETQQRYRAITTGMQFTCALRLTGEADCWGWGVGMGSGPGDRSVGHPTPVHGGRRYSRISAADEHVCALDAGGVAYCWGRSDWGQHEIRWEPTRVTDRIRFVEVTAGPRFGACALTEEGAAYCWGGMEPPRQVPGAHRFTSVHAAGHMRYCGVTPGGSVLCWRWEAISPMRPFSLPARLEMVP
jgi:alpha-tubulin suppressor-like RCC1 family protein